MIKIRILAENIIVPYNGKISGQEADNAAVSTAVNRAKKHFGCECKNPVIHRKSVDARRKNDIKLVYSVCLDLLLSHEKASERIDKGFKLYSEAGFAHGVGAENMIKRPVIVGFGPAGIFCALALAENGYSPIVFERGGDVNSRVKAIEGFINTGILDTETNIQFGAGGAGTFSDGKLTTRINDPLCTYVLSKLVELGAPDDILTKAKPHIGTDILREVVNNADKRIRELGGEIQYNSRVDISGERISVEGAGVDYGVLVLAIGHSARDTYESLMSSGYVIEPKAFSVGVRAEHLQSDIDKAMHGDLAGDETLGHAEYSLSYREGERGVYSFCMCPGGEVVCASSEEGGVVTNGMSHRKRDGVNANAALAVSVLQGDYGNTPMGAIAFQRELERKAFIAGGSNYTAPMQTVGDLLEGKFGSTPSRVMPTYMRGNVTPCDLNAVLPSFVSDLLKIGIRAFGKRIEGFDRADSVLTGVETRTSAPVRIMRNEGYTAVSHGTIYPCGEGAGYAGGIMSAAIDGLKVARAIMEKYSPIR